MLQPGKGFITEVLGQKSEQKYQNKVRSYKGTSFEEEGRNGLEFGKGPRPLNTVFNLTEIL